MSQVQSFVVTARNIEAEAIERSAEVPVLLEFWAEWCEPCKTLTPILEKVVADYGGAFVLGKIDVEQEHQLAQVFQVQSVPYAVLMVGRRPVDAFTGAQTEAALGAFLSRNGVSPAATGADATPPEPDATAEQLIAAHRRAAAGDAEGAREALAALPEDHELLADSKHLVTGLDFLEAELPAAGPEAATCLRAARERLLFGGGGPWLRPWPGVQGHVAVPGSARCRARFGGDLPAALGDAPLLTGPVTQVMQRFLEVMPMHHATVPLHCAPNRRP
ncbi:MAG: thioredoxin family protein [Planctomycetota bacterium]|jgi:thiol-disulfide isomerase/thioredoxin